MPRHSMAARSAVRGRRSKWIALLTALSLSLGLVLAMLNFEGVGAADSSIGIYTGAEVPTDAAAPDSRSVELGVQFSVSAPGSIVAIRYYKSAANSGVHVGTLWSSTGKALAKATFGSTSRRTVGWQTARLSKPVAVSPGVTYVASYHTNTGKYAMQPQAFAHGATIGNSSISGSAGVYKFGRNAFPTKTFNNSAYYVDALFVASSNSSSGNTVHSTAAPSSTPSTPTTAPAAAPPVTSASALPEDTESAAPTSTSTSQSAPAASGSDLSTSFASVYKKWANGPNPTGNPAYFPIGVFYQSFDRPTGTTPTQDSVLAYMKAGINLQVGGYDCDNGGCPNGDRDPNLLGAIKNSTAANPVACACDVMGASGPAGNVGPFKQISTALANPTGAGSVVKANFITAYDEADMNQVNYGKGSAFAAPAVSAAYAAIKAADPSRPVVAGYGKCFSIPNWVGCQADTYSGNNMSVTAALQAYCANVDIVSSDYYANDKAIGESPGYNYLYGQTIDNERAICGPTKVVGFDVNTGDLGGGDVSPADIKAATWDGVMHGANFVNYFVDDIDSNGGQGAENGLLQPEHASQLAQVTADNTMIHALAPWLNAPSQAGVTYTATNGITMTTMLKTYGGHTYLFAIADGSDAHPKSGSTTATLTFPASISATSAVVYGEGRSVSASNHTISDSFSAYQVHVYELS